MQNEKKSEVGYHIYVAKSRKLLKKEKRRQLMMPVIRVEEDRARKKAFS